MKNIPKMEGMLSMLELYSMFEEQTQDTESPQEDYLHRSERLMTLAKEKLNKLEEKIRRMENSQKVLFEIEFRNGKYNDRDCFMKIRLLARKLLRSMKENEVEGAKRILDFTDGICVVRSCEENDYRMRYISGKCSYDAGDRLMELDVMDGDNPIYTGYGLRDTIVPLDKPSWLYNYDFLCEDLSNIIAYCAMYGAVRSILREKDTESEVCANFLANVKESMGQKELEQQKTLRASLLYALESAVLKGVPGKLYKKAEEVLKEMEAQEMIGNMHFCVAADDVMEKPYRDGFLQVGVEVMDSAEKESSMERERSAKWHAILEGVPEEARKSYIRQALLELPFSLQSGELDRCSYPVKAWKYYCLEHGVLPPIKLCFIEEAYYGRQRKCITRFLRGETYWNGGSWLMDAFQALYEEKHSVLEQYREYKKSASGYALSFMDKKNIPQKTVKAMEKSLLNAYFGYVEYDEDVDLSKVAIVEKEFQVFKDTYLSGINSMKNAVRFRKLGNHKAVGLYYPGVKCLCVDFRYPTSFVHEYGHLIDYELGELSLKGEFHRIRTLYKEYLSKRPEEEKKKMKGKYNLAYYLKPTEVFARSFELYARYALSVDNDLLPKEFDKAVYPCDEESFMQEVTAYFDALLKIENKEERDHEAA